MTTPHGAWSYSWVLPSCLLLVIAACDDNPGAPGDAGPLDGINGGGDGRNEGSIADGSNRLSCGILGQYSALAASGGKLMASAYEQSFGDLVMVTAGVSALSTQTKEIVDGVPSTAPTKDPAGWRGGIEDVGDDVGTYTDIVVSTSGTPMISYHDHTNRSLKFAVKSANKWVSMQVDKPTATAETRGLYTSMILVNGSPAIAYLVTGIDAGSGKLKCELRWAQASKALPTAQGDWTVTTIESNAMPCQNMCASGQVCVLNSDKTSQCKTKGSGCSTCSTNEACVEGKCTTILPDSSFNELPLAVGLWPTVVSTASGPTVLYYDRIAGNLEVAQLSGATWKSAVLQGTSADDVGGYSSAALDKSGTVHVTYQNLGKLTLHYLQLSPSTLKATATEVIDDGVRSTGLHPVGADSAVIVDSAGLARVVYQDQQEVDLLQAKRSAPSSWTPKDTSKSDLGRQLKGGVKGYGFFNDVASDGGKLYVSTFVYDTKATPAGSLEFVSLP